MSRCAFSVVQCIGCCAHRPPCPCRCALVTALLGRCTHFVAGHIVSDLDLCTCTSIAESFSLNSRRQALVAVRLSLYLLSPCRCSLFSELVVVVHLPLYPCCCRRTPAHLSFVVRPVRWWCTRDSTFIVAHSRQPTRSRSVVGRFIHQWDTRDSTFIHGGSGRSETTQSR